MCYNKSKKTNKGAVKMRKEIMERAWYHADMAALEFGGKKSEYFAECLKQAWALYKKEQEKKNAVYSMVVISDNDKKEGTMIFFKGEKEIERYESLTMLEAQSVMKDRIKRGYKKADYYKIDKGVKTFQGTKTF